MAFTPRLTAPSTTDLRWIQINSGGYNQCIYGSSGAPSVLPNCTGYVHGRCMEIAGIITDNMGLSFNNAITYYTNSSSDWVQTQDPSLGAIVCYYTNNTSDGHPGHVAIVEQIIDNDTIVVSESHYGGARFAVETCYRRYGWRPTSGWNVSPQGFLKNPYVTPTPPPVPPTPRKPMSLMMKFMALNNLKIKCHR